MNEKKVVLSEFLCHILHKFLEKKILSVIMRIGKKMLYNGKRSKSILRTKVIRIKLKNEGVFVSNSFL